MTVSGALALPPASGIIATLIYILGVTAAVVFTACGRPQAGSGSADAAWLEPLRSAASAVKTGDLEVARREYRLALDALGEDGPPGPRRDATRGLARAEAVSGNLPEAEALYLQALEGMVDSLGVVTVPGGKLVATLGSLADLYLSMGRPRQAEAYFRRILDLRDQGWVELAAHDMGLAFTVGGMSRALAALGDSSGADSLAARAMGLRLYAEAFDGFINDKVEDADAGLRRALSLQIRFLGPHHEDAARTSHLLAEVLRASGRTDEAQVLYRRAIAAFSHAASDHLGHAAALDGLAELLKQQGNGEQSADLQRQAHALRQAYRVAAAAPGRGTAR